LIVAVLHATCLLGAGASHVVVSMISCHACLLACPPPLQTPPPRCAPASPTMGPRTDLGRVDAAATAVPCSCRIWSTRG